MAPTTEPTNNPFSNAELRLIVICFKHMKSIPEINFDAVAEEYGYKSAAVAKQKFGVAKGKCKGNIGTLSASKASPLKKGESSKASGKRKATLDLEGKGQSTKRRMKKNAELEAKDGDGPDDELKDSPSKNEEKEDRKVKEEVDDDELTIDGNSI